MGWQPLTLSHQLLAVAASLEIGAELPARGGLPEASGGCLGTTGAGAAQPLSFSIQDDRVPANSRAGFQTTTASWLPCLAETSFSSFIHSSWVFLDFMSSPQSH